MISFEVNGVICHLSKKDENIILYHKWYPSKTSDGRIYFKSIVSRKSIYLHRLIIGAKKGQIVDHKNGNTLDNRRENLRIVSASMNNANQKRKNKSGFQGVSMHCDENRKKRFYTKVQSNGVAIFGGYFKTAEEAYEKYKQLHIKTFGENSFLNRENYGKV